MYQVLGKKVATILPQNFSPVAEANEWLTLLVPLVSIQCCGNRGGNITQAVVWGGWSRFSWIRLRRRVTLSHTEK
jgi:hypothetical protein